MDANRACPFCERLARDEILASNGHAAAFLDGYPLSPGHCLIVPRRHVSDFFALTKAEQTSIFRLLSQLKSKLERERVPDGYNVGINIGPAAGQTVWHAHVHLIPRYVGDVEDPRGGIRWVIPALARYWMRAP